MTQPANKRLVTEAALATYAAAKWQAARAYSANDLVLAPDGSIIQRIADGTSRGSYDATEQALWTVKSGSGSDLPDVTVAGASGQLAAGKTSNVAASGAYTSPTLDGAVATPPKRWSIKAASTAGCTVTYPDQAGTPTTVTLLAGEALTFRQKTAAGWGAESGNKPLTQMDLRFTQAANLASDSLTALLTNLAANTRGNRIAQVGDSITEGSLALSPYNLNGFSMNRYYNYWWMFSTFQQVRNFGNWALGGSNIEHARDTQVRQMLDRGLWPDSLILAVGTNNLAESTATAWAKFQTLLRRVAMLGIRPILTTIPPNSTYPSQIAPWNALIRALATQTGLPMIERNTPVRDASGEGVWSTVTTYTADGTHPNPLGHNLIGLAAKNDATLMGKFDLNMPGFDRTTPATGPSTDAYNMAGVLWNTDTGWDWSGWTGTHAWSNAAFTGDPVGGNVRQLGMGAGSFGTAFGDIPSKVDTEVMALMTHTAGSAPNIYVQPRGASANLGSAVQLVPFPNIAATGAIHGIIKAPLGMDTLRLYIVGSNMQFGAITARRFGPVG